MKKSLGKKVELGLKLVPIPLSLLLTGTMAVTIQADEVNNETDGNQVQNNQSTPPITQELPNDGTIKNTPAEGPSGLTVSEQGENGAAQVTPEIKRLAQEFYDYHTQEERDEITKAATMTSVMPEIQSVEQIEEAAKKYDHAYAIRKMDGVFKYINLKEVENLNLVKDEDFRQVPSKRVSSWDSFIQNNTALFFLNKWESIFNPNPTPEEVARIPKSIIPRSELDLTVDESIPKRVFLRTAYTPREWHGWKTYEEAFSRKYLPESDRRILSMKEIRQIYSENPDMFRVEAFPIERRLSERGPINPYFQKIVINQKEVDFYSHHFNNDLKNGLFDTRDTDPLGFGYRDPNEPWRQQNYRFNESQIGRIFRLPLELDKYNDLVYIDWLGNNPTVMAPWFGENNIKTFHYKLYLMKPHDRTRYYIDRDYTIQIEGVHNLIETPDGGLTPVEPTFYRGGKTILGLSINQPDIDRVFRTVKAEGFVFKLSDVKKVDEEPGKVLVRYQDDQGNAIANPIMDKQLAKTRYTVSPKPLISYKNQLYTYKSRLSYYDAESGEYEARRTKRIVYEYVLSQFQLPNDAPSEERPVLEMTRFVDESGQELSAPERGLVASKTIAGLSLIHI